MSDLVVILGIAVAVVFGVYWFVLRVPPVKAGGPITPRPGTGRPAGVGGAAAGGAAGAAAGGDAALAGRPKLRLYFGSQTGTAEGFAKALANEAKLHGLAPTVVDLEEFSPDDLEDTKLAIFLMATYGEGDPTDNAQEFNNWLTGKAIQRAEDSNLSGMNYTVFGLGNRQYEHYNKMGKLVDARLAELGAPRMYRYGEGDDDGTLEEDFESWKEDLWHAVREAAGLKGADSAVVSGGLPPLPDAAWKLNLNVDASSPRRPVDVVSLSVTTRPLFTGTPLKVMETRELRKGGDGSTLHVEFHVRGTPMMKYNVADTLTICPENRPEDVEALGRWLGYDLDSWFELVPLKSGTKPLFPTPCTVRDALTKYCDLSCLVPKTFVTVMAHHADNEREKKLLTHLVSREGKAEYAAFVTEAQRNVVEMFEAFPSVRMPLLRFMENVPRLIGRQYTICSSPLASPDRIQVVVTVVKDKKPGDGSRTLYGVCSNYMDRTRAPQTEGGRRVDDGGAAGRAPWPTMLAALTTSTFKLPADSSLPIVMIGPGTGIAPMRAFLQHRSKQRQDGKPVGDSVLFFGCRRREEDFIYEDELLGFCRDGTLTKLVLAFSRETAQKVYVQDKMREEAAYLYQLLGERGGYVYVCGGTKMGHDVHAALEVIGVQFKGSEANAKAWIKQLQTTGRYVQELWS